MTDPDQIVPPPIPFADETIGELEEASRIFGVPVGELVDSVQDGANRDEVRPNPANAYEDYFIPTGKIFVKTHNLDAAARDASTADSLVKLSAALDRLEKAVMTEDHHVLTKTGKPGGTAYLRAIAKFRTWLKDPVKNKPPYTIFAKGNKKLPFWAFSTLPDVTCPGAGDCLVNPKDKTKRGWCYSFSAWRNVTPYFRQLQNTILLRLPDKTWIEAEARKKFKPGQVIRLYVDGDFDSLETLTYWMHFCDRFPENSFYGYSKSWVQLKQWHKTNNGMWPKNYVLNLSSGTMLERVLSPEKFRGWVLDMMSLRNPVTKLPLVRGTFRALQVSSKFPKKSEKETGKMIRLASEDRDGVKGVKGGTSEQWSAHRAEVREVAKNSGITGDNGNKGIFVCPGYCGECLPGGKHACGDRRYTGVAIVIGIH